MFMLLSTHKALMKLKDEQIADLKRIVFPGEPTHADLLQTRVENAILDGQPVLPQRDEKAEAEDLAEANRILSGQYDNAGDAW